MMRNVIAILVLAAVLAIAGAGLALAPRAAVAAGPDRDTAAQATASCADGIVKGFGAASASDMLSGDDFPADDSTAQWIAFDLARLGLADGADGFLSRLEGWVTESYAGPDKGIDAREPTTWARVALVVNALGADPTAFGTNAKGAPANLLADGIYDWAYTDSITDQGSNACIYGIEALDSCGATVPAGARYSEQDLIDALLAVQAPDGSFGLSPGVKTGSVDLTGMALAALAPHSGDAKVAAAIEKALAYLSAEQKDNGRFESEGAETSESSSMVVIGLCALGIDPAADERFVKSGGSALDGLLSFQRADGTFSHMDDDRLDRVAYLASEQGLRALIAYDELLSGGDGNVYTADVALALGGTAQPAPAAGGTPSPLLSWALGLACGAAVAGVAWLVWHLRRARGKRGRPASG